MRLSVSHMSLHPLCVSLRIVRGWRRVGKAGGAAVLPQPCFRTLLSRSRPLPATLPRRVHLIGRSFLYGRSKAHAVVWILRRVPVVVVGQLRCAVQQAAVTRVIPRGLKGWVRGGLLALCGPGVGVELGVGGVGHPGRWTGVVAARPGARHRAGGDGGAGGR